MTEPTVVIKRKKPSVPSLPEMNKVHQADVLEFARRLPDNSAQIIIADPPYNIGKDFGNKSDQQTWDEYLKWCDAWIKECLRILRDDGQMFIYGFSEHLAYILTRIDPCVHRRWLVWHYINKNSANNTFWQRSHESILCLWKRTKVFHCDDIREPYSETFIKHAAGKPRKPTEGRFSNGTKETVYNAHANGALPRDVIKVPALAGGAGKKERVNHPTQKPIALSQKLLVSCRQPAENGFLFVPFAGSGSECVAALSLKIPFLGCEINPDYIKLCEMRLAAPEKETEEEKKGCEEKKEEA